MQFFAVVLLASLAALASAGFEDKEKMLVKKWMIGKAMESCFGPETTKKYMMMKRKAMAECSGMDAPELDLPFFQAPFRVASGLMQGASSSDRWMEEMMKKYMFEKMMRKFSRRHRSHHDDDDDDRPFMEHGGRFGGRFRRQAEEEVVEDMQMSLGDRLIDSLKSHKEDMENEIGNKTCVCRKMGILDENNDIDLDSMLKHMEELEIDPWLKERLTKAKQSCYDLSQALPKSILDGCITGPKMVKLKFFKMCMKKHKVFTCMSFDMRQKLEENFGSVEELTRTTGLEEKELLPLTMKLMLGKM